MAIIKCPECGHHISDKAPTCPSCGVEIAGKVVKCSACGEVYFKEQQLCPHCHIVNQQYEEKKEIVTQETQKVVAPQLETPVKQEEQTASQGQQAKKKKGSGAIFVSFFIAIVVCGICYYMYQQAQDNKEREEFEYALQSKDPLVLQGFLDTFKDAPEVHRDSIEHILQNIKQADLEWINALNSNSKSELLAYMEKHPDSQHKAVVMNKIDSLDWIQCSNLNNEAAYQGYMTEHPEGEHYDEAEELLKQLKVKTISDEEKAKIKEVYHNFFVSINEKDEEGLKATLAETFTLLDKTNANKSDAVEFMHKLHKDTQAKSIWKLANNYDIKKREIGDSQYEYNVTFSALQDIQYEDASKNKTVKYRITSTIDPEGTISLLKMVRLIE